MISTPKYGCDVVSCNVELPIVYLNCLGDPACDRHGKTHFEVLNLICRASCHLDRMLRSEWSCLKSGMPLIRVYMSQSSTNSLSVELVWQIVNIHKER